MVIEKQLSFEQGPIRPPNEVSQILKVAREVLDGGCRNEKIYENNFNYSK